MTEHFPGSWEELQVAFTLTGGRCQFWTLAPLDRNSNQHWNNDVVCSCFIHFGADHEILSWRLDFTVQCTVLSCIVDYCNFLWTEHSGT